MLFLLGNVSCGDPALAVLLSIIKKTMNIIWIAGPIIATIGAMIAGYKLMSNPEEKKYKNILKNIFVALVILFLLPLVVNIVMRMFDGTFEIASCWNDADHIVGGR